ncbi:hypothetical protein JL721_6003 [Aureococcus anophagefferens]|nr:hypothetical protein JL721_6003 [Aureococcus anophagefferens]
MGSFRPPAAALLLAALLCGAQPPSAEEGASSDAKDASSDEEGRSNSQQTLSSSETNRFCRLANSSGCWGRNRAYGDDALLTFADLNVTATYEPTRLRPALGDLDGDADLDLVVGASDVGDARDILGHRGDVFLFWNVGSALAPAFRWDDAFGYPFLPATVATENPPCAGAAAVVTCGCDFPCANVTGQLAPALADLDGDADLDLADAAGAMCPSPSFADFDGDGDLDMVLGASNGSLHYYVNEGNATAPRLVESDAVVFSESVGAVSAAAAADVDGDGDVDVLLGEMMPYVNLARNVGSRYEPYFERPDDADEPLNNWAAATAYDDLTQACAAPAVGDLDGDGLPDVLVGSVDGLVVLYLTTVSEAHYGETWEDLQADSPTQSVAFDWGVSPRLVDADGDGDLDVILSSAYGGAVYLLENDGGAASPHFALHGDGGANAAADAFAGKERMALAVGDVDGDGAFDVAFGDGDGAVAFFYNRGSADAFRFDFADPDLVVDAPDGRTLAKPELGDVDGDADLDLVATYAPAFTPIVYFENGGNASRPAFVEAPSGQNPFDAVDAIHIDQTVLALYDVDADGDLDLLLAKLTGTAVYYANFGSSTAMDLVEDAEHGLNEASLGALATAPAVALGDLDGDGAAELLVGDQGGFLTYYANSYCQLASGDGACSLRGLCRAGDGRYAAAACECLSGTTGDQCGAAARLLGRGLRPVSGGPRPEGGGEDRNAPRITDTCGVAGSGRSRGSCDDGAHGGGNCTCFDPFTGASCADGACPAGTVETAELDDSGLYYAASRGRVPSPRRSSRESDRTAADPSAAALAALPAARNFWRAAASATKLYACELDGACRGGNDTARLCRDGHEGVLCGTCAANHFYDAALDRCLECATPAMDISESPGKLIALGLLLAVVLALVAYWARFRVGSVARLQDTLNMLVTGREDDFAEQEAEAGGAPPTWLVKVKIMLGLFQIIGAMPWSLPDVSFPARLLPVVAWANYLNFDLLSWVPMECFGRFGYFDQLVSTTLAPLAGLGVVALVTAARRATAAALDRRAEIYSQGTYAALLLTFCVLPGCSSITFRFLSCARYDAGDYEDDLLVLHADPAVECRGDRWNAWRGYVGLMLCVYPVGIPLSYFCVLYRLRRELDPALDDDRECDAIRTRDRAGSGFDDVDDMFAEARARYAAVVAQGRKIEARKTRHAKAVEPVACPAARIFDPTSTFLVEEYEPRCYLFSVFECFRRVALTGGLTVFAFGGATQAAMGLLISLVSYKVYAVAAPFIEDDDDLVSEVAQLELVFVFFSALMLVVADTAEGETSHARAIFSAFLGLAFALGLAVVVFIVAVELWGRDAVLAPAASPRGRRRRRRGRRRRSAAAPRQRLPVAAFSPRAPPKRGRGGAAQRPGKRRPARRRAAPDTDAGLLCWVGCFQPGDDDAPRARASDGRKSPLRTTART